MSYDIIIEFREEPKNLNEVLTRLGFKADGKQYKLFDSKKQRNPLTFSFDPHSEDPDEVNCGYLSSYAVEDHLKIRAASMFQKLQDIDPEGAKEVAAGNPEAYESLSKVDLSKVPPHPDYDVQIEVARKLEKHYNATIVDPNVRG